MQTEFQLPPIIDGIARKHLGVVTLEFRNDSQDINDLNAANIKDAPLASSLAWPPKVPDSLPMRSSSFPSNYHL